MRVCVCVVTVVMCVVVSVHSHVLTEMYKYVMFSL